MRDFLSEKNNDRYRKGLLRSAAFLLAAGTLVAAVCSLLFLVRELDHDCTGEDCPVCAVMQLCEGGLRTLSAAGTAHMSAAGSFYVCAVLLFVLFCLIYRPILASHKVRLNN